MTLRRLAALSVWVRLLWVLTAVPHDKDIALIKGSCWNDNSEPSVNPRLEKKPWQIQYIKRHGYQDKICNWQRLSVASHSHNGDENMAPIAGNNISSCNWNQTGQETEKEVEWNQYNKQNNINICPFFTAIYKLSTSHEILKGFT